MSTFASTFKACFDNGMSPLQGEAITYRPKAGGTLAINAIVDPLRDQNTREVVKSIGRLRISKTDVTLPVAGDTATVRGELVRITSFDLSPGDIWLIRVSK